MLQAEGGAGNLIKYIYSCTGSLPELIDQTTDIYLKAFIGTIR